MRVLAASMRTRGTSGPAFAWVFALSVLLAMLSQAPALAANVGGLPAAPPSTALVPLPAEPSYGEAQT